MIWERSSTSEDIPCGTKLAYPKLMMRVCCACLCVILMLNASRRYHNLWPSQWSQARTEGLPCSVNSTTSALDLWRQYDVNRHMLLCQILQIMGGLLWAIAGACNLTGEEDCIDWASGLMILLFNKTSVSCWPFRDLHKLKRKKHSITYRKRRFKTTLDESSVIQTSCTTYVWFVCVYLFQLLNGI